MAPGRAVLRGAVGCGGRTLLALVCAMVPPSGTTNVWLFEGKLVGGTLVVMVSAWLVYRNRKSAEPARIGP